MSLNTDDFEQIRQIIREELDATTGLQEDEAEPTELPGWYLENADGVFNVKALLSENQLRMIDAGRHVAPANHVFSIYHRSAIAVRDGVRGIADTPQGERLRRFMADNPEHYGS